MEGMTNQQFNSFLEIIACLIEAKAKDEREAAEIVRSGKITDKEKAGKKAK